MYKKLDQAALDAILECGVDEFGPLRLSACVGGERRACGGRQRGRHL